ncbi:MAG TPA: hypothetical protein VGL67_10685, partial [Casimicrobiaceae bacterium]
RCFDLKESTAFERLRGGRTERAFTAWNKTRRALYGSFAEKAMGFRRKAGRVLHGNPRPARHSERSAARGTAAG